MHEDNAESLVAIKLGYFVDLLLNHSEYKMPYDLEVKEKLRNKDS